MILIDANALIKKLKRFVYHPSANNAGSVAGKAVLRIVNDMPVVDAAPVVRCNDCWKRGNEIYCPMCFDEYFYDEDDGGDWVTRDNTEDDGFCHNGAKMNGGAEG